MASLRIVTDVLFVWNGKHHIKTVSLITEDVIGVSQAQGLMADIRGENNTAADKAGAERLNLRGIYTHREYL